MKINDKINQALREFSKGNKENAYKELLKIFKKDKNNNQLRFNIAVIQQDLNINTEARKNYEFLINNEKNIKAIFNLYLLNIKEDKFTDALRLINQLIESGLIDSNIIKDKAFVLYKLKRYDEAEKLCLDKLKKNKNDISFLNILGLIYFTGKNYLKSEKILKKANTIDKNNTSILNSLGRLYHERRDSKNAEKYFLEAYKLNKTSYEIINNLAGFYREEGKYHKAAIYYKDALNINPNNPSILNNIAKTYFDLDDLELAEEYSHKALNINKDDGNIQKILSLIYLRNQNYKKAWNYFDGRLNLTDFVEKNSSIKKLRSKLFLNKKLKTKSKILILREQGIGDEILYGTMYSDLLQKCENVTIECDRRLKSIFQNSFPENKFSFVNFGDVSENNKILKKYDYVIYAGSLGKYFRNNLQNFNSSNLLLPEKKYVLEAKKELEKLSGKYNIGLSWRSFKNRYSGEKSIKLDDLKNILNTKNCNFINLQYGDVNKEIKNFNIKSKNKLQTINHLDLFNDFNKIAGVLKNLDLFISVSNSTAHLAGSLGVKTILVKPTNHALFHYWNQSGENTPWYKSIIMIEKNKIFDDENFIKKYLNF